MLSPKRLFKLFVKAGKAWVDDFAPSMGAAISYYTVFSLAPLLIIVIAMAGAVFGREAVQGQIVAQISGLIGQEGASLIQGIVASASETDKGLVAGVISLGVLMIGATTVFAELQSALDRIWHVPEAEKPQGIWAILRARLLSFGLILGLVFLLIVSLAVSTGVSALGTWAYGLFPGWEATLQVINIVVSIGFTTLLFAMIFKLMPTTRIAWRDVWTGALVTAILFEVGKFLISLYLGKSGVTESFAAAGSLVVLLAWVYYAAQIFLLGAEFTKVYADEHGSLSAAKAVTGTAATAVAGKPPEVSAARPAGQTPAIRPAATPVSTAAVVRVPLQAAKAALISEVIALVVVSVAGALLSNRRKGLQKKLRWAMRAR